MNSIRPSLLALSLLMIQLAQSTQAQNLSTDAYLLDETIVTSSKTERKIADVPIHTRVIHAKELQKLHALKLKDALVYVPGIQVRELHGKTGSGVWMQGLDANRVLILIDGNPIIPSSGSSVDVSQIAVGDIERIEIIKGAMSSLYGTSAMGGVINVITKKPAHKFEASVDLATGNWQQQSAENNPFAKNTAHISASAQHKQWYAQVITNLLTSYGYQVDPNSQDTQGWRGHKNNFSGKVGYTFSNRMQLTTHHRLYKEDVSTTRKTFFPGLGNLYSPYTDQTHKAHNSVIVEQTTNGHSWKARLAHEDHIAHSHKVSRRVTTANNTITAIDASSPIGDTHLISYGGQLSQDYLDSENLTTAKHEVDKKTKKTTELYVQDSYFASNNLEIMPGVRLDKNDRDGQHIAPSINNLYKVDNWFGGTAGLRFGIGQGYRSPNLKELFYVFDHSQVGYMVLGNTALDPEKTINTQASIQWSQKPHNAPYHSVEFSIYKNSIQDLIEAKFSHDHNNVSIYKYQNIREAQTQGFEIGLTQHHTKIKWDVYYNYLQSEDLQTQKELPKRPKNSIKASVEYNPNHHISFLVKHTREGKSYVDTQNTIQTQGFSVTDMKVNYSIDKNWATYGGVNNIGNIQRKLNGKDFRPAEGRFIYIGMKWKESTD